MSTMISSLCWLIEDISPAQKIVLISLADQANDQGVCWPSMANMQRRTCLSERAVRNAIRALEQMGFLKTHQRDGRSSYYTVTPAPDAAPPRHQMPDTPAPDAGHPGTRCPQNRKEPSKEPSNSNGSEYPPDFEVAWSEYPKRQGGNPKRSAFHAWRARVSSGVDPQQILDGIRRYKQYLKKTDRLGTQFVKQAVTFFGKDEHFKEDWSAPAVSDAPVRRHTGITSNIGAGMTQKQDGSYEF